MKRVLLTAILASAAILFGVACLGQEPQPDRNGEVRLDRPIYKGVRASAPIPPELHQKNSRGSDGQGLCVIASMITAGRYQGVPGPFLDLLWKKALARPGGYSQPKLEALIAECNAELGTNETFVSYYGPARSEVMDTLSRKGYPMGVTITQADYGTGIHHMVTDIEYRTGGLACLVDNNRTGVYRWMLADRRLKLSPDGDSMWVFAWSRLPPVVRVLGLSAIILSAALLLLAATTLVGGGGVLVLSRTE